MDGKRPSGPMSGGPPRKRGSGYQEDDDIEDFGAFDDDMEMAMQPPEEEVEVELGEAGRNWMRPAPPQLDPAKDKIGKWKASKGERALVRSPAVSRQPWCWAWHACRACCAACPASRVPLATQAMLGPHARSRRDLLVNLGLHAAVPCTCRGPELS